MAQVKTPCGSIRRDVEELVYDRVQKLKMHRLAPGVLAVVLLLTVAIPLPLVAAATSLVM